MSSPARKEYKASLWFSQSNEYSEMIKNSKDITKKETTGTKAFYTGLSGQSR